MTMRVWTREAAIEALHLEAKRLGRPPGVYDTRQPGHLCPTDRTLIRLFGTWSLAMKAAGMPVRSKGWPTRPRKSVCHRGHPRTPENLDGQGHCKTCRKLWIKGKRKSRRFQPDRLEPEIAEQITALKKAWWANGGSSSGPAWVHPYRRRSA